MPACASCGPVTPFEADQSQESSDIGSIGVGLELRDCSPGSVDLGNCGSKLLLDWQTNSLHCEMVVQI